MSGENDFEALEQAYRLNDLADIPLSELRDLYRKLFDGLLDEKLKYEEYERKFTYHYY